MFAYLAIAGSSHPAFQSFLLYPLCKKYYTQTGDQDDLISIGTIGLIKGITTYRPDKGARLATYAARCIENAMLSQRPVAAGMGRCKRPWGENGIFFRL
jgi:hypothetical protein